MFCSVLLDWMAEKRQDVGSTDARENVQQRVKVKSRISDKN